MTQTGTWPKLVGSEYLWSVYVNDACNKITQNWDWRGDRIIMQKKNIRNEPRHDKTNKVSVRPAKTQISLGIRPVLSAFSLCAQGVAKDPSFLHVDSKDSDQTERMPRLIWVFAGRTVILLVLSWGGSNEEMMHSPANPSFLAYRTGFSAIFTCAGKFVLIFASS